MVLLSVIITGSLVSIVVPMCIFYKVARAGHSTTLFGSKLIMFGGEDIHRKLLNDIHILNLETMTWNKVHAT